jgi:hypothetical protein
MSVTGIGRDEARARLREKFLNPRKLDTLIADLRGRGVSEDEIDDQVNGIWGDRGASHAR